MEPLKYYLLSITTYCGEFEFRSVITKESTSEADTVAEDALVDWYGDGAFEGFSSSGYAEYANGLLATCDRCEEITEEEYKVFQKCGI